MSARGPLAWGLLCLAAVGAADAPPAAAALPDADLERLGVALERGEASALQRVDELVRSPDPRTASRALLLRAQRDLAMGRLEAAELGLEAALARLASSPHVDMLAEILSDLGYLADTQGRYADAERQLEQATAYSETLPHPYQGETYRLLRARVALRRGDRRPAEHLAASEARCPGTPPPAPEEACLASAELLRGLAALDLGDLAVARASLERAAAGFLRSGRARSRTRALVAGAEASAAMASAGPSSAGLDRPAETAALALEGVSEAERLGLVSLSARAHLVLGQLGDPGPGGSISAEDHLERAREAFARLGSWPALAKSRGALARLLAAQGRLEEAALHWRAAHRISERLADRPGLVQATLALAALARQRQRPADERALLEAVAEDLVATPLHALSAARLGELALASGDPEAARRWLGAAAGAAESMHAWFPSAAERERFRAERRQVYELLVEAELAAPSRGVWPALRAAERASAQALLDLLERSGTRDDGRAPARDLASRVGEGVAATARALAPGVALVKYHLKPGSSLAFVLHDAGLIVVRLAPGAELARLSLELNRAMHARVGRSTRGLELAGELHDALLRPLETALGDRTRLVILPDAELRLVPFDALIDRSRKGPAGRPYYAIDRLTISYAPSMTSLSELHRAAPRDLDRFPLLAFGDPTQGGAAASLPRLTWAGREVESAERHLAGAPAPGTAYVQAQATEGRLKSLALDRYRVLHLATHGLAEGGPGSGTEPALVLAPSAGEDGLLRVAEVMALDLAADLVVLSACSSGEASATSGDGLSGLTSAFLSAGASSVMATLWPVEDAHTARLMDAFYGSYAKGAHSPAALRQARLALLDGAGRGSQKLALRGIGGVIDPSEPAKPALRRRSSFPRSADPFFWAPFMLVGDVGDILR